MVLALLTRAVSVHGKLAIKLGHTQDCAIPLYFKCIAASKSVDSKSTDILDTLPASCCCSVVAATSILFGIEVYTRASTAVACCSNRLAHCKVLWGGKGGRWGGGGS